MVLVKNPRPARNWNELIVQGAFGFSLITMVPWLNLMVRVCCPVAFVSGGKPW
jgi:hypothetical protein